MMTLIRKSWFNLFGRGKEAAETPRNALQNDSAPAAQTVEFDIAPNDPLLAYLLNVSSVVEVDRLHIESPTLAKLKQAGVKVVVPLISQGELIGLLNLGPRRSEQDYSADDRRLLNTLASQAAPALRVAQLVRQQQAEARERERLAQELRVARVIQQTLLPKEIPTITGWQMAAHWQPARAVSGDFYDFFNYPDGRMGIIVGDVTDKGVPAALVMATTRSILRAAAERMISPGALLEQANNALCPDIPPNMFVTCLYMLLDPRTGRLVFANAGHNLPYQRTANGVVELRARGMPLGLMPDMTYEEKEAQMAPGDQLILYSDGLIEAHNPQGEMFGFPRLRDLLSRPNCARSLIHCLLNELTTFTGPGWEQEDDVTFVSLERVLASHPQSTASGQDADATDAANADVSDEADAAANAPAAGAPDQGGEPTSEHRLAVFEIASQPGNERQAMEQVASIVEPLHLTYMQAEHLKTAVAEASMNAMEHGNHYRPDQPVEIEVCTQEAGARVINLVVRIIDHGGSQIVEPSEEPDLDAKLAGMQSPRGWGLFLIKNMVDEMNISSDARHHTIELILHLESEAK